MSNKFVITAVLQLQAPKNLQNVISQINRQLSGITANINVNINSNAQRSISTLTRNINTARKSVNAFTSDIERAGFQAGRTLRRYAGFTFATGAFISLGRAISSGINDALEYEKTLNKIRQVTGTATKDLSELNSEIVRLSTSFGVNSKKISDAALTLSQAGLSADKTKTALEALAKTELSATFDDIKDTTEGAIAIFQQFNVEAQDLEKILGSINTVSAKFAVESSDIVTAIRRTGGAFSAAGGNINELIALFTSVRQTTRESAESIATGFRTIFTRLQRTRTQDFLKTLGIDTRDIEGQFVGPYEAIKRLSEALRNISTTDPRFSQIVEELGGFRQVSKVIPLIQKFDVSQRALNIAQRSGNSITEDAAKAQETLANQIAKVTEEFAALLRKVASTESFKGFISVALTLASTFIKLADSLTPLLPLLASFGTIKLGQTISAFGKGFKGGISGFASGGLVPGSGNGDTVPAMLTPGEFVIRKNAVKAVGAEHLASLNKKATGGTTSKEDLVNMLVNRGLSITNAQKIAKRIQNGGNAEKLISEQLLAQNANENKTIRTKEIAAVKSANQNPSLGTLESPAIAGLFVNPLGSDTRNKTSIKFSTLQAAGGNGNKALANISQTTGLTNFNELEVPIAKEFINPDIKKVITEDFINQYVELVKNVSTGIIPTANFNKNNIVRSQLNSVGGYFFENIISSVTNQFSKEGENFDFKPANKAGVYKKLFGDKFGNYAVADAKYEDNTNSIESIRKKVVNELNDRNSSIFNFIQPKRFAKGGAVDSVPAMLTPGEFVINKKAAASIGRAGLENLNRGVKKFAKGGLVDTFAGTPERAFATSAIVTQFVGQIGKSSSVVKEFADVVSGATIQFSIFSTLIKGLRENNSVRDISNRINNIKPSQKRLDLEEKLKQSNNYVGPLTQRDISDRKILKKSVAQARLDDITKVNRNNNIANVASIGGIATSIAGDALLSNNLKTIQSGNGTQANVIGAKAGGVLSGIGQGAALGSILGPYGAAIGAVTGGLVSLATTLKEVDAQFENAKFLKEFDKLAKIISNVSSGKISPNSGVSAFQQSVTLLNSRLITATDSSSRETLNGKIDSTVTELEVLLNKLALTSKSFEEFKSVAGNTIAFFATNTSQSIEDVNNTYKKQIEINNKVNNIDKEGIALKVKEYQTLRAGLSITAAFEKAGDAADSLFNKFTSLVTVLDGNISSFEANANAFKGNNLQQINAQSNEIGKIFGNDANGLVSKVQDVARLQNELPDILLSLKNKPALDGSGFVQSLVDELRGRGFNNNEVINSVRAVGEQKLVGREGKDVEAINELFKDLTGASKDLLRSFQPLTAIFEDGQEKLNNFLTRYSKTIQESIKIQQKHFESELKLIDTFQQIDEIVSNLFDERTNPLKFESQRNQLVTGGRSSTQLFNDIVSSQNKVDVLSNQRNNTNNPRQVADLTKAITQEENSIIKAKNALEFLADTANRAAPLLKELDRLKGIKDFTQNAGKTLVTGSAQEQRDLSKSIFGASKIFTNQSFSGLTPGLGKSGLEILNQLGEAIPAFKTAAKNAVSNDLQKKFGISKTQADVVAGNQLSSQEEKLAKALGPVLKESIDAQKRISDLYVDANTKLITGLDKTFNNFLTDLKKTFEELNKESKQKLANEIGGKQAVIDKQQAARKQLLGLGVQEGQFGDIQAVIPKIKELQNIEARRKAISEANKINNNNVLSNKLLTDTKNEKGNFDSTKLTTIIDNGRLINDLAKIFGPDKAKGILNTFTKSVGDNQSKDGQSNFKDTSSRLENILTKEINNSFKSTFENSNELKNSINLLLPNETVKKIVNNIDEVNRAIKTLEGKTGAELDAETRRNKAELGILGFNSGGSVSGIGNTDTVPAMLTPGEFVLRKDAVAQIGIDNLHKMNATGYASGGKVQKKPKLTLAERKAFRKNYVKNLPLGDREFDKLDYSARLDRARKNLGLTGSSSKNIVQASQNAYDLSSRKDVLARAKERVSELNFAKNNKVPAYSSKKFAGGGLVGGGSTGNTSGAGLSINNESLTRFNQSVNSFSTSSDKLSQSLDNFPREITMSANHKVEVIINGAQVLTSIMPEIQKMIESGTKDTLNRFIKDKMPDVGEIQ